MLVYVLNVNGQPLMPTERCGKVRRLLKTGKAKVIKRCPFTIQLLYKTETEAVQLINLGVDAGSKTIGLSATTESKVLYEAEVTLRNDIVELLSTRRESRRTRRNHKTRYRKCRFLNRTHSKHEGWVAPSVLQKIETHLIVIGKLHQILPISKVIVEVAAFDTQLLKAKDYGLSIPEGEDYQNGDLKGWNTREYVLFRDGHKCRCCNGRSGDKVLQTHHLESRKTGGNAPSNLLTLCKTCHDKYHKGKITLPDSCKRGNKYNDAVFMGIMRWTLYNRLKAIYPNVCLTYGYITKNIRINAKMPKEHYIDARCISKNPTAKPLDYIYRQKKVRCHNRQIHKFKIQKDGTRKLNQAPYLVKGFRLFDKVRYQNKECFIFGRRRDGRFAIRLLDGTKLNEQISYKKIDKLESAKHLLTERRSIMDDTGYLPVLDERTERYLKRNGRECMRL